MTENMAGRGEGLAGLVAKLAERWEAVSKYTSDRGYKTALISCAGELRNTAEAAAPPSTPAKGTGFVVSGEPLSEAESRWLKASAAALATPSPQAPRKWGAEIAARAEFGDLSPTSAREQSSATASFRLGVLLTDKIWQLRERGKELAKNPQEYFRGLADGFESLANELEALARPSVGEQK